MFQDRVIAAFVGSDARYAQRVATVSAIVATLPASGGWLPANVAGHRQTGMMRRA
jgi:hypothetical protein